MDQVHSQSPGRAAWRAYRQAFEVFSQRVRRVQDLTLHSKPDRDALNEALLAVEEARAVYRDRRDALASCLMQSSASSKEQICRSTAA